MTNNRAFRKGFAIVAALATIACMGTAVAAEKIRFEDIPQRLAPFGTVLAYRAFNVITVDGKKHGGRRLLLEPDHVRIFYSDKAWADLASAQISRIEIGQRGRFFHHIQERALVPLILAYIVCGNIDSKVAGTLCLVPATGVFSPFWAYTAVTAPVWLAADCVTFLIPPKVYEIVPGVSSR